MSITKTITISVPLYELRNIFGAGFINEQLATTCVKDGKLEISWEEPVHGDCSIATILPMGLMDEMRSHCLSGNAISAIKALRTHTGWSLKGSKDYVDYHFPADASGIRNSRC